MSHRRNRAVVRLQVERLEVRNLLTSTLGEAFTLLDELPPSTKGAQNFLQPTAYVPFSVDHDQLDAELDLAPLEFTAAAENPIVLDLPAPDGSVHSFEIVEAPIMAPELSAKFPNLNTFRGVGISDPTATIRLDLTHRGFHAQVLSPNGGYHIDPFYHLDDSAYVSYYFTDARVDPTTQNLRDELTEQLIGHDGAQIDLTSHAAVHHSHDDDQAHHGADDLDGLAAGHHHDHHHDEFDNQAHEGSVNSPEMAIDLKTSPAGGVQEPLGILQGETLRTYRLANAATAEYTNFHGGTVQDGQAAIVTAINRVVGIFEIEFAVRMELIADNDQLVYTSNPDPYTNQDGFAMLQQNQDNIDAVIGSPNYDIGHVFSTGGGGVAFLGVVGDPDFKAQGVTGLSNPIGDPFSVDYVSHEIGHQFDALHTFNGCGNGGGGGSSSYEPGSGSTIMAYAGICGIDNLQNNSDPYFHWKSLQEVTSFVNSIPGVGTETPTGNTGPTADAGPDFAIPTETPFRLTGAGSDIDSGDVLTYTWEQADLGPALRVFQQDNGESPLFRSWQGTTDPVRILPRLEELLENTTPKGERMPTLPREMDWRLTVRDNALGGGGYDIDGMTVSIVDTGSPFEVTPPNSVDVIWTGNTTETIAWNVAGTDGGVINTANVNIKLSTDGGYTYPITLAENVPNDGTHDVTVPNVDTDSARIMVEGSGNIFFDLSNFNYAIEASSGVPGDFDGNGELECADVDELTAAIASGNSNLLYDLNGDMQVNADDLTEWIVELKGTALGDANLDFFVDGLDFIVWNANKFDVGNTWCTGDFNADGLIDGLDFIIWNANKFQSQPITLPASLESPVDANVDTRLAVDSGSVIQFRRASFAIPTPSAASDAVARRYARQSSADAETHEHRDELFAELLKRQES